ncbi:MAG: hypothetical protein LBH13_04860 [Cellulomonadaceae bacterium]|jgi:hypothetical protein|nr:hypothetical protein [Cellulomonadaceae bacterium]
MDERIDHAAESAKKAFDDGVSAAKPLWQEKVAPAISTGAQKVSEVLHKANADTEEAARRLVHEDSEGKKLLGGLASIGSGLSSLGEKAANWVAENTDKAPKPTDGE